MRNMRWVRGEACSLFRKEANISSREQFSDGRTDRRMDRLGDGKLIYSDSFELVAYVVEEDSWIFDVDTPAHARVNLTMTIHPYNREREDYSINIDKAAQASNFSWAEKPSLRPATRRPSLIFDRRVLRSSALHLWKSNSRRSS